MADARGGPERDERDATRPAASESPPVILVVLAAGLGRRFGGLKQLAPVGPAGEAILDYTVHDALDAGFDRIVLVVRVDIEELMIDHTRRWPVRPELVFQDHPDRSRRDSVPVPTGTPGRTRPLGTAHAVLAAQRVIGDSPFAVANADDLYGTEAVRLAERHLSAPPVAATAEHAVVGYRLDRSFLGPGPVSRAICEESSDGLLSAITESTVQRADDGSYTAAAVDPGDAPGRSAVPSNATLDPATPVSTNLWAFQPEALSAMKCAFVDFVPKAGTDAELQLPEVVGGMVASGQAGHRVRILHTSGECIGVTHAADLATLRDRVAGMVRRGEYPGRLWGKR